jgi:type IV pilus assembly protein PilM
VERAGLVPTAVDLTSFAVLRSLSRGLTEEESTVALVDIGARITNIVVHSSGVPHFVRLLLMGGQDITDALAERLGTGLPEAEGLKQVHGLRPTDDRALTAALRAVDATAQSLVDEIRGSLDYYRASNGERVVEKVVLSGGGALLAGLTDRLSQATRLPVEIGNPMAGMRIGRTGLDEDQVALVQPLAAVPVGLALGGVR